MLLLADLSFWNLFWILVIWIPLILLWAFALIDLFRREDISGIAKVLWLLFILLVPLLGVFVYFLARPPEVEAVDAGAGGPAEGEADVADSLARLAELRDQGVLSEAEFAQGKAKVLGLDASETGQ